MISETKYLGVIIGTRLNIAGHVAYVSSRSKLIFSQLSSVAKSKWGLSNKVMTTIYKGVFVPIITYAAASWADKINVHHRRRLKQAQRYALIRVTKAYRTISTDALCVIAGVTPIELQIEERKSMYLLRKNISLQHFDISFAAQESINKAETNKRKTLIRKETTRKWQEQWSSSNNGRLKFEFYPNVQDRLNATWINHNHYLVQILSGHGNFYHQLKRLGLVEQDTCKCGDVDTVRHVIFDCVLLSEPRKGLESLARANNQAWPCELKQLVAKKIYECFCEFVRTSQRTRETFESGG
ncbi:hypothetical protein M0802_015151 [Mischocyttarus mexicanus]|nr:hypothetical protein M0802_015151 [Mischocyttarus mexicanus]